LLRCEPAARREELGQRPALDELHHDELRVAVGARVEDSDDVRVAETGCRLRLATEPCDESGVAGELRQEDLDRDSPVQDGIEPAIDLGHTTGADPCLDAIALAKGGAFHAVAAPLVRRALMADPRTTG